MYDETEFYRYEHNGGYMEMPKEVFWDIFYEYQDLEEKYNKALELLVGYNMPCEIDGFMDENTDYCEKHCSDDDEQYKKCWDMFIRWKLKDKEDGDRHG